MIGAGYYGLKKLNFEGKRMGNLIVVLLITTILFISRDANPTDAWSIGSRTYQSAKDPIRSVISWSFYAGYHQDYKGPSLYVKNTFSLGDKIIALGPLHMASLYYLYLGKVDYTVAPTPYKGLLKEGKIISYITGSEYISDVSKIRELINTYSGRIWLLGDDLLLSEQNSLYSKAVKNYLRSLTQNPDFVGADNHTFAVKIQTIK